MDMKEREIQYCNPEELIPYEKNPRDNRAALDAIELSIKEYGFMLSLMYGRKITNNYLKLHGGIMAREVAGRKGKRKW